MVKRTTAAWICGIWIIAWWALYPRLGPVVKAFALSRMGSTADYFFTYMGPELLVFAFGLLVLPVLYLVALRRLAWWLQLLAIPALVAAFTVVVYYDVMKIAREAERLCTTQAGLRVYRTVEAEGIYGVSDIRYWAKYGFKWVEYADALGGIVRSHLEGNSIVNEFVKTSSSLYEYRIKQPSPLSRHIEIAKQVLLERSNSVPLAELIVLYIHRGWADRAINPGFEFVPPACAGPIKLKDPDAIGGTQFIKNIIKPKQTRFKS